MYQRKFKNPGTYTIHAKLQHIAKINKIKKQPLNITKGPTSK